MKRNTWIIWLGLLALPACVRAQVPYADGAVGQVPGEPAQTVTRRVSHPPLQQETPSVLLPGSYYDTTRTPLAAGNHAPDFSLPLAADCHWTESGQAWAPNGKVDGVTLSKFIAAAGGKSKDSGKPTVLMFWAFWCDTWKDVTHDFKKLRPELDQLQASVLCVAVDASQQPVAQQAFESREIWFPVVIDTHGGSGQGRAEDDFSVVTPPEVKAAAGQRHSVGSMYGVRRVPTFFVLDGGGLIRARFEGFPGARQLVEAVREARQKVMPKITGSSTGQ